MPWTTLDSILKRGVANSNISNVMKITRELGVDTESLASGTIIDASSKNSLHSYHCCSQRRREFHSGRT